MFSLGKPKPLIRLMTSAIFTQKLSAFLFWRNTMLLSLAIIFLQDSQQPRSLRG